MKREHKTKTITQKKKELKEIVDLDDKCLSLKLLK